MVAIMDDFYFSKPSLLRNYYIVFRFNPAAQAFLPSHLGIACKPALPSVCRQVRFHTTSENRKTQSFPFSALILLRRLFLLAARHSANKFALCARSAASVPFSHYKRKPKNKSFPFSAFRFPFLCLSLRPKYVKTKIQTNNI